MSWHKIRSKVDRALVVWLIDQGAGEANDTFPAKRASVQPRQITICHTTRATEDPPYSGVFRCDVEVVVRTLASDEPISSTLELESDARVGSVFDALHTSLDSAGDKLAEAITTTARTAAAADAAYADLADLTLLDVRPVSEEGGFEESGAAWEDTLRLEIVAVPSDVS